ncbi:hypothetical protein AB0J47_23935 [Nocardia sp. NPDC049737]|uniref:hypothetical protein n=1 Tax=Nocardia sp. NPDC049737 TaxID=3154358 RepID=UPI00342DE765
MSSLRAVVVASTLGCSLLVGPAPAHADPTGGPAAPVLPGPSDPQRWIDAHIPAPSFPPAASPPSGEVPADLAALWQAVRSAPSGDRMFDAWPDGLDGLAPGDIVEWRDVTATSAPLAILPIQRAILLKFRTTDASGVPSFGTATFGDSRRRMDGSGGSAGVGECPADQFARTQLHAELRDGARVAQQVQCG